MSSTSPDGRRSTRIRAVRSPGRSPDGSPGRVFRLYTHQARALETVREGRDLVLTTPTASGKTLAFTLPVLERLALDGAATALYLYPTKALANDQLRVLLDIEAATGLALGPAVYDGDTPASRRPGIRNRSRIVLSNPYELHQVLPWHARWHRFLAGLQVVVVDEAHRYRGVFGANIAFLLRRLRRVCRHHGGDPVFVISTATLANPTEFAGILTGRPAVLIDESGAPRGPASSSSTTPPQPESGRRSPTRSSSSPAASSTASRPSASPPRGRALS